MDYHLQFLALITHLLDVSAQMSIICLHRLISALVVANSEEFVYAAEFEIAERVLALPW